MSEPQKVPLKSVSASNSSSKSPSEQFTERESNELVIGFSGPVGSGVDILKDRAAEILNQQGYAIQHIKLSDLIKKFALTEEGNFLGKISGFQPKDRYKILQKAGNDLRQRFGNDILAELAITKIATIRTKQVPEGQTVKEYIPPKTAYLIDQLKHPGEVKLLRTVYKDLFYLIGVFASADQRKINLKSTLDIEETDAISIMEKDRKENIDHGQQLDKTLKLSDLFIRNTHAHNDRIDAQFTRFHELLHGKIGISPTNHEHAMYAAYSAGLRSACLSRQVGAAISDKEGNIIATGCNDVPKSGGGLYNEMSQPDSRCVNKDGGKCYNDHHKNLMVQKITQSLVENANLPQEKAGEVALAIKSDAGLKDLLEFSRSVHAEMDAITTIARVGASTTKGSYLYTTTYPCHNCARHIIAAGITKVFYIEPYEKSLARELHRDAIESDPEEEERDTINVQFMHFEGISPRQYQNFFYPAGERKDNKGIAKKYSKPQGQKIIAQILDDYRDLESKVSEHLTSANGIPDELFSD